MQKKHASSSPPSPGPPNKKTKTSSGPILSHAFDSVFKGGVYTPLPPALPSPLSPDALFDPHLEDNLKSYGDAVRLGYFRALNDIDGNEIFREDVQNACDGKHIVWSDAGQTFIIKSKEGLKLYVV